MSESVLSSCYNKAHMSKPVDLFLMLLGAGKFMVKVLSGFVSVEDLPLGSQVVSAGYVLR